MKRLVYILIGVMVCGFGYGQKKEDIRHNAETNLIDATYYHENGQISQKGTFDLKGKLHGQWISFNELGETLSRGQYDNGKRVGTWHFWEDGIIKEVQFDQTGIVSVINRDANSNLVIKD